MGKILLVEDQIEFQLMVKQILDDGQNQVVIAGTIHEAQSLLAKEKFDIVLLDISLPDRNGLEFYAEMQGSPALANTPVVFLTSAEGLPNKITAFSLGAEDYITKPFNAQELRARVLAKIRKNKVQAKSNDEPKFGPFQFKLGAQRVYAVADNKEFDLTPREFRLLYLFARHGDIVLERERILNEVWGPNTHVTDRTVDTNVYLLRKKLGPLGACIEAVAGVGYRFRADFEKKSQAS